MFRPPCPLLLEPPGSEPPRTEQPRSKLPRSKLPRGFTVLEMLVAFTLLGAASATMIPLIHATAGARKQTVRRQLAAIEVSNLMEVATARPWEQLTTADLESLSMADSTRKLLKEPELSIQVAEDEGTPAARRIQISLRWKNTAGDWLAPVRLTGWVYAPQEDR